MRSLADEVCLRELRFVGFGLRFTTLSRSRRISKNAPVADAAVLLRRRVTALTDMGNENGQLRESQQWGNSSKEAAKTNR